jgi:uncharacterized protein
MRALLDVNVLVALLDASHLHHRAATDWLQAHSDAGWASGPLTQNGCLRILALPSYPNSQPVAQVAERLRRATAHPAHTFWPDSVSLLSDGLLSWRHVLSPRQVSDLYLLALAVANGGRLVSFDAAIPLHAVPGAQSHHLLTLS